jgi:hypothetical protein
MSTAEFMRLPPAEHRRILASRARQAEVICRQNPEMLVDDFEAPFSYG